MNRTITRLLGSPARNLVLGVGYMSVVAVLSIVAYVSQGWTLADAAYMVVLTLYTVGYDEVRPVDTPVLRAITMISIILGCTGMIFLTGALVQAFTLSQLQQFFGSKRMQNQIGKLDRHVIVCGYGRIGVMLAQELEAGGADFIILERDEARLGEARDAGHLCQHGDATDEAALHAAGIDRARILATVLPDDAANVFITLSARSLNPAIQIIARGELPSTERKLLYAGADKVVLPTHIGAERIAEIILFPQTARMIASDGMRGFEQQMRGFGLEMEVVAVAERSPAAGLTIEAIEAEGRGAFYIVALDRHGGERVSQPGPAIRVDAGDGLVLIGRGASVRACHTLFA